MRQPGTRKHHSGAMAMCRRRTAGPGCRSVKPARRLDPVLALLLRPKSTTDKVNDFIYAGHPDVRVGLIGLHHSEVTDPVTAPARVTGTSGRRRPSRAVSAARPGRRPAPTGNRWRSVRSATYRHTTVSTGSHSAESRSSFCRFDRAVTAASALLITWSVRVPLPPIRRQVEGPRVHASACSSAAARRAGRGREARRPRRPGRGEG